MTSTPTPSERAIEQLLDEAVAAAGVDPAYREQVRAHVDEPDERWRYCCGSACDPCVQQIGRAVDLVRRGLDARR